MFESIIGFFKKLVKSEQKEINSKETAKERLHLVLMQDRANVSADFLELMKQEIIEVIKKYIDVEEEAIDVRLTNEVKEDGTTGAPSLYANIPIINIKKKENVETEINNSDKKEEATKINTDKTDKKKEDAEVSPTKADEKKEENSEATSEQQEEKKKDTINEEPEKSDKEEKLIEENSEQVNEEKVDEDKEKEKTKTE